MSDAPARAVLQIPIGSLVPHGNQPRTQFDPEPLAELACSIAEHGILQPLLVVRVDDRESPGVTRYRIVAGERRWRAATMAGLSHVPALVLGIDAGREREVALVENLQRVDLHPLELAQAYEGIIRQTGITHEHLAQRLGKSRVTITNTMRLLGLGLSAQRALIAGEITEGHARALLGLSGDVQDATLAQVLTRDLTVRRTEALVRRQSRARPMPPAPQEPEDLAILGRALQAVLGTRVAITGTADAGKLVIEYASREELERLCLQIGGDDLARELG
jgi:ParB family chromosome partitioning protein